MMPYHIDKKSVTAVHSFRHVTRHWMDRDGHHIQIQPPTQGSLNNGRWGKFAQRFPLQTDNTSLIHEIKTRMIKLLGTDQILKMSSAVSITMQLECDRLIPADRFYRAYA